MDGSKRLQDFLEIYFNKLSRNNYFIKKTIKILFTINSLKKKTIHSKTLFTISVDLKST